MSHITVLVHQAIVIQQTTNILYGQIGHQGWQ